MTRGQQTAWIVGAVVLVGAILAFVLWPAPNLDGLSEFKKCSYYSFYKNRGGTVDKCQENVAREGREQLMRM